MMPREASPWSNSWPPLAASGLAGPAAPSAAKLAVDKAEAPSNSPLATNIRDSTRFMKTSRQSHDQGANGAHACPHTLESRNEPVLPVLPAENRCWQWAKDGSAHGTTVANAGLYNRG